MSGSFAARAGDGAGVAAVTDPAGAMAELARSYGVQTRYRDNAGRQPRASPDVLMAVLRSLGAPIDSPADAPAALAERRNEHGSRLVEPVVVAWEGRLAGVAVRGLDPDAQPTAVVELEDGGTQRADADVDAANGVPVLRCPERLPFGYHVLRVECGGRSGSAVVLAAPRQTWRPPDDRRQCGLFAPLYALHSRRSMGCGDLGDLGALTEWAASLGVNMVGTLPLLAAFLDEPYEPSPYAPVTRRMWNELHLDLSQVPGLDESEEARARADAHASTIDRLRRTPYVDRQTAAGVQRDILEPLSRNVIAGESAHSVDVQRFLGDRPEVLDYAVFRAAGERHGGDWRRWPEPMAAGTVDRHAVDRSAVDHHVSMQWLLERQIDTLRQRFEQHRTALYLDLPLGSHPHGWDAWRCRSELVDGLSVGAPPDQLHAGGQNWGFAPLHPDGSRATGHRYFRACVAHHARVAGVLRIDHVMGLHRLFCMPDGSDEGVYLRQPADELWAVVCLESHRQRCVMVGENLGTVPSDVNRALHDHGLSGMWVAQFDPFGTPQPGWLACIDTHDTPTFAGWWRSCDHATRQRVRERLRRDAALDGDGEHHVLAALLRLLADSDAAMTLVSLEDLWLEVERQNVPGTTVEHPNWRRRMQLGIEDIESDPEVADMLRNLTEGGDHR